MSATYPLDRLGVLTSNKVKREVHTLHPVSAGEFNFIVPRAAPFFGTGVVIKYFTGEIPDTEAELDNIQATRLVHGSDYLLTHRVDVPSELTESALYASISFIDIELEGNVILEYRTIGSDMVVDEQQILQTLADKVTDPRGVYWNDVVKDIEFPPSSHLDDAEGLYGMEALITQLRQIEIAIAGGTNHEHFHEISNINGLADRLVEMTSNRGAHKLNVAPDLHIVRHEGPVEVILPDFDSDIHCHVKLGVVGSEGYSRISIHADIPKAQGAGTVVAGTSAYFEDAFLSDQAKGHLVYRHSDGSLRMTLDIGTLENVMIFVAEVSVNTPNARAYLAGWGITSEVSGLPAAVNKPLDVLTGGGLQLDFAKTGEIKPNTCWMVKSDEGSLTRALPLNAPDASVIAVRDHGNNASKNRATIMGAITYSNGVERTGLYLDNSRGWIKFQYLRSTQKWHVVSGT